MKILTTIATLLTVLAGALLAQSGGGTSGQMVKLEVSGMHCKSCVQTIERSVRKVTGVDSVFVDMRAGFVEVRCDSPFVRTPSIAHMIHRAGFRVKVLVQ
jgi:copper chaperone CopZ